MATKQLSITEARNLARNYVLDSIKGTPDTPTKVYYKGITVECALIKGGATLEILSQNRDQTFKRISEYLNRPEILKVSDRYSFTAVKSSSDFYKSFTDALIVDIVPKLSRVPILTVLLYSRKYNASLQKYLDDPNPLSKQIEKDLSLAFNHLFESKVFSKLTEPFRDVLSELSGKSFHTGARNTTRNVEFNGNEIELSDLNSVIADVTLVQPRKTSYISVKYSSGRGKRFFILSTSALSKYFYNNSDDHTIRSSVSEYFGLDGKIISEITNNLENRSLPKLVLPNLEGLISKSIGKDIYLYHWTRLKGPELYYFDRNGASVSISDATPLYNEAKSSGLVRIVADNVSINNKIYKAEFEFRFKANSVDLNIFLQSR